PRPSQPRRRPGRAPTRRSGLFSSASLSSYWFAGFYARRQAGGLLVGLARADDLTRRDGLAGLDGEAADGAGTVRVYLVLHLHRLDDADHTARLDLVTVGDRHGEHRALH